MFQLWDVFYLFSLTILPLEKTKEGMKMLFFENKHPVHQQLIKSSPSLGKYKLVVVEESKVEDDRLNFLFSEMFLLRSSVIFAFFDSAIESKWYSYCNSRKNNYTASYQPKS
jgi:hypothetical protein